MTDRRQKFIGQNADLFTSSFKSAYTVGSPFAAKVEKMLRKTLDGARSERASLVRRRRRECF